MRSASKSRLTVEEVRGEERLLGLQRGLRQNLKTADLHLSKAFAGGRVYCSSLVDKLLCESFYNSRIIRIIELLTLADVHGSRLFIHQLPHDLNNRPFGEVFEHFVHHLNLVPIGIYRAESTATLSRPARTRTSMPWPSAASSE